MITQYKPDPRKIPSLPIALQKLAYCRLQFPPVRAVLQITAL
jgi:hypothetical protein